MRSLDFVGLNALANRLANGLADLGVGPEDHVAWWGPNSLETLAAMHAIRKAGAVSVPIPYRSTRRRGRLPARQRRRRRADHRRRIRRGRGGGGRAVGGLDTVVVYGGGALDGQLAWDDVLGAATTPAGEGLADATRTMIYTSGTTGLPKGAVRKVGGAANQFGGLLELLGWDELDPLIFLTTGPLYHSGPSGFALRAQLVGGTVVTQYRFDAEDWLRLVDAHRVSATFSAPTPIRRICSLDAEVKARYDVSSMRTMIANAAPWTMTLKQRLPRRLPRRFVVGGVRLDRVVGVYGAGADRSAPQAGLVRTAGAGCRDPVVRRPGRPRRHPGRPGRALRPLCRAVRDLSRGPRSLSRGSSRRASRPSATSPTATTRATSTSAIARRT